MKKLSSFSFALIILLLVTNEIVASCPSTVQHPPCVEFWRADAVFIAMATEVEIKPQRFGRVPPPIVVRLTIEESFKGIKEKEIVLELNDCGYQFKQGEKYLVYAHRNRDNDKLNVRLGNTRTKPLSEATEDLDYLRSLQRGELQAQIVGKIGQKSAEIKQTQKDISFSSDWFFFGAPMPGIRVFAKGAEQTYETFSDVKGEYKFSGLPPAEYEIWADYPSSFESKKETVKTTVKGCGIGNFVAWRKGAIFGRVSDAGGSAIPDLLLSLVYADARTDEILEERENKAVWYLTRTDKKGEYGFTMLPAGRYFVIINRTEFERKGGNKQTQKIPRLFYPGVSEIEKATVITIKEGERVEGKDFRLSKSN